MHWGQAAGVWTLTSEKGPSVPPTPRRRDGGALLQTRATQGQRGAGLGALPTGGLGHPDSLHGDPRQLEIKENPPK